MTFLLPWINTPYRIVPGILAVALAISLVSCQKEERNNSILEKPPVPARGPDYFEEVTAKSPGLKKFICRNGEEHNKYTILETVGAGVGVIDFDGDGLLDLVLIGGGDFAGPDGKQIIGYPTRLFKNLGNFVFQDVTEEVLPQQTLFYSHGVAVCDYDCDGWPDLLVTGYGRVALYRNVDAGGGKRKFVDVTKEAGLLKTQHFWATSAAFADLDGDGWPDLYICQYVDWSWENNPKCSGFQVDSKWMICNPGQFNARQHALYRNTGQGKFVEVTEEKDTGMRIEAQDPDQGKDKKKKYCGNGLGVLILDLDGDGRPDIYVANDITGNFLYLNQSEPGKIKLAEAGQKLGAATDMNLRPDGSMGADAADIDGTGHPAIWVTNFEGQFHGLYRMIGPKNNKRFYHATLASGLGVIGKTYVGWGTGFVDLDNDGWMDLVITNGHVYHHPPFSLAQKPVLFWNKGDGKGIFQVITDEGGPYFQTPHRGRGLAIADLNNDGYPDLVINNLNEPPAVLKNICPAKNHWLGLTLVARDHADTVGAKAVLRLGKRTLTQFQKGGGSYLSARDGRLLFGLGQDTKTGTLSVHWRSGEPRLENFDGLAIDCYHKIEQGKGKNG